MLRAPSEQLLPCFARFLYFSIWPRCVRSKKQHHYLTRSVRRQAASFLPTIRCYSHADDHEAKGQAGTKLQILEKLYRERKTALAMIAARYGPLLELYLAKTRLEAQFQRLVSIYRDHAYDAEPVRRIINAGIGAGLDFYALTEQEAVFERRVWNLGGAIWAFRKVLAGAKQCDLLSIPDFRLWSSKRIEAYQHNHLSK